MIVRIANESDLPALMTLLNEAFQVERSFLIGDRLDPERTRQHFQLGHFLLAEEDGALVGCVYVELRGDHGYLGMLSISPSRQKQGLGRKLVWQAEEFARNRGARFMDLTIISLRTELPPYYEKLGYTFTAAQSLRQELVGRVSQPCHLIQMSKPLSAPATQPSTTD
jgi:predicted N-acetyltransferase YhbS